MRILYVCADRGIPVCGQKGASVHVRSITSALADQGHRVTLAAARLGEGNPQPPVHRFEQLGDDAETARAQLAGLIESESVQAMVERYSLQSGPAALAAREHNVPFLLEVNAPLVHEAARYRGLGDTAGHLRREQEVFRSADVIQVVSTPLRDYVRSVVPGARVHVLPNGVDVDRFAAASAPPAGGGSGVLAGFVGSMKAWHGVMDLLDAFAAVSRQAAESRLVLVGSGPEEDAARRRILAPDLAGRVTMTGAIPHARVPAVIRSLDIAVAPYRPIEGFYFSPLKVLEYLAAGRPVVYPRLGDLDALVGDGGLGYAAGDVAGLAAGLERLTTDADLRRRLGARAAERARAHAWYEVAARLTALLEQARSPAGCVTGSASHSVLMS